MKLVDVAVLSLAIVSIVFGILGATGATGGHPSMMSLIAGGGLGAGLLGFLAFTKTNPRVGRIGAAVITLVLVLWSASTFFRKGTWYPHGIMMILSIATLAILLHGHFSAMKAKKAQI